jgi:hypothetical protein
MLGQEGVAGWFGPLSAEDRWLWERGLQVAVGRLPSAGAFDFGRFVYLSEKAWQQGQKFLRKLPG